MNETTTPREQYPDSIEIGTPAKGGALKVYFDASKIDEAKERVDNANKILEYGKSLMTTTDNKNIKTN